ASASRTFFDVRLTPTPFRSVALEWSSLSCDRFWRRKLVSFRRCREQARDTHRLFPDPSRTSEQRLRSRPGGGRPAWMDEILIRDGGQECGVQIALHDTGSVAQHVPALAAKAPILKCTDSPNP